MKLVTNKSKNLLYRIKDAGNVNVQFGTSYAIATQTSADTNTNIQYKCQYRKNTTYLRDVFGGAIISSTGKITRTFTTPADLDYNTIVFGLNGKIIDTLVSFPIKLKPSTTYTFTCNFTNITQGSISWKDMMLVEGSTAGDYEPYSYNLLDKNKFSESNSYYINNGDGSITTTGTVFSFQRLFMDFDIEESSSISKENSIAYLTYGHKLLINDNCNSTGTNQSNAAGCIWEINSSSANAASSYGGKGEIYTNNKYALADMKWSYFYITNRGGEAVTCAPALYDLTLMYGAGNEPTTVEQFYTDYPELKVSPLGFIGLKNLEISNKNIKRLKYATTTRNLFDLNKFGTYTSSSISIDGNTLLNIIPSGDKSDTFAFTCSVSVKKNTNYIISMQDHSYDIFSCYVYTDEIFGNRLTYGEFPLKFNSGDNESLAVGFYSIYSRRQPNVASWVQGPQIEEGSTATSYVPYGYLDIGIIPSNSGYILDKYNNLTEELLEENIEKDNINYHIPDKTNILLNKIEGKTNKIVQIADKSKYSSTSTTLGVKFTNNSDGTFTINGTNDGTDYSNYPITNESSLTNDWLKGHKYLFYFSDKTDLNYYAVIGGSTSKIEYTELGNTATGRSPLWKILSPTDNSIGGNSWYILRVKQNATCTNELASPQVFDLTAMYGFGKEPTTVEQFKKDYPQFFDSKLDGIWNVRTSGVSSTGKNLFDIDSVSFFTKVSNGEYKSNTYIGIYPEYVLWTPVDGTKQITISGYVKCPVDKNYRFAVLYEDGTEASSYMSSTGDYLYNSYTSDTSKKIKYVYLHYTNGSNEVYIKDVQIEEGSAATTYEPYTENKIDLLSTQTLNGINGVNDYIEVIDKGNGLYDLKKTQNIDSVDMGTLGWDVGGPNFASSSMAAVIKTPSNNLTPANCVCDKYVNCPLNKSFVDGDFAVNTSGVMQFRNSAYTTAAAFKTAVTGTYFYYQLKTPVTTTIATNLTYNQVSAIRTNGGLLLVNDNNNQKYVRPDVTLKENYQYKN